jgi:hypothetical protein
MTEALVRANAALARAESVFASNIAFIDSLNRERDDGLGIDSDHHASQNADHAPDRNAPSEEDSLEDDSIDAHLRHINSQLDDILEHYTSRRASEPRRDSNSELPPESLEGQNDDTRAAESKHNQDDGMRESTGGVAWTLSMGNTPDVSTYLPPSLRPFRSRQASDQARENSSSGTRSNAAVVAQDHLARQRAENEPLSQGTANSDPDPRPLADRMEELLLSRYSRRMRMEDLRRDVDDPRSRPAE